MQVYQKFKNRSVDFVSLTNNGRDGVEEYIKGFAIPWPCGYGASLDTIKAFGVFAPYRPMEGWEANPTIYLIGPDARILWTDGSARLRHPKVEDWTRELEQAIERMLQPEPGRKHD